jgi:predicted NBD/HSP70 family sugar kinase
VSIANSRGDLVPSAILGLLGTRGNASRTEIARTLDVSPATVTQVTKSLIARGLVEELELVPSRGGRPSRMLGLVRTAGVAIGAKVTADHVVVVEIELDGSVVRSATHTFRPSAPDALQNLASILVDLVDGHDRHLLGVGVGVPGSVDSQASGMVDAPTIGWTSVPVGSVMRAALDVPVLVDNDVNTLAAAERLYGVGRDLSSYLVVTIGRGVGCGIVVDGSIYRGSRGGAGEIGHVPVHDDGPVCGCGSRGCLESYVGDLAMIRRAVAEGVIGPRGTMRGLLKAAHGGDERAITIYRQAGELLGRGLAGVVHTLDPEAIVLMGEGIEGWQFWEPGFEEALRRHLMPSRRSVPVVVESWSEEKWALGAASLVLAAPFDAEAGGDQARLVRARLQTANGVAR